MRLKYIVLILALITASTCAQAETTKSLRLRKESSEAADALKNWTIDQKNQYLQKMRTQFEELEPEIESLKSKADAAGKSAKTELEKYVDDLDVKRARLEERLDTFTTASKAAWADIKQGTDEALSDLQKAYKKAKSRFE